MVESATRFEEALASAQVGAEIALKSAAGLTRELRKARTAPCSGQVRELRRALDAAAGIADELALRLKDVGASYDFDESGYMASGEYAKELLALASESGLAIFEEDERLQCYPSLIRVLPSESAIEIDRRRERRLRPSALIGLLGAAQRRPPKFRAEQFMQSLADAYDDLVVARAGKKPDAVVRLIDLRSVLTLLPGQGKEYTKPEFARDLYLLDQSGCRQTRDGRGMRLHASSTRTAGVLITVARTGRQQVYWGVSFAGRVAAQ
jgi:hypothetical protein